MADNVPDPDQTASLMSAATLAKAGRSKTPLASSAWLDRMAGDAGHLHVQRLAELVGVLETHARARNHAGLAAALEELRQSLPGLRFDLLQARGWWARTTGKGRSAGAEFADLFEQVNLQAAAFSARLAAMQKRNRAETAATDRALVEVDVECGAMDKVVDQGTRWLQDMQSQLTARHAAAVDAPGQQLVRDDAARCDILMARLKLLRDAGHAGRQAHQQGLAVAAQCQAGLQQLLACDIRDWQLALSALAMTVADGAVPGPGLERPMAAQATLQGALAQAAKAWEEVLAHERELAACLDRLSRQLEVAGA